jgi:outer membrane protein OmpA-like peptidoglycan-associated protein
MKNSLLILTFILWTWQVRAQKNNDTFRVYFDLNVPELSNAARTTIDSLFYYEKIKPGIPISIIGYADYLATEDYNLKLSEQRAVNVKQYLQSQGIRESQVKLLIGKGEIHRQDTFSREGMPTDRKVEIVMEYHKPKPIKKTGEDTTIVMQPWKKALPIPTTADPGFDIMQIETGSTFILKNIYFPMGRHFPKSESFAELDKLLEAMKENPQLRIQIEGHVCCISNVPDAYDLDSRDMDLSVNRARFIYEYLRARNISADRLNYIGYGKSRPIVADEQTAEEAAMNRRVEIRILEK